MDLTTRVAGSPHLQDDLRGRQEVTDTQTDRQTDRQTGHQKQICTGGPGSHS